MNLSDLEKALNLKPKNVYQTKFKGVGTDTREDLEGQIFFALRGDTFDAHDFISQALEKKASALILDKIPEDAESQLDGVTVFLVKDTLKALHDFANYWRKKINPKLVAISGSAGKTTTKDFCTQILKKYFKVHSSPGSFNNHWGVPLSILQLEEQHEVMIQEMGMNHKGELETLCAIAEPDIVLVTNVGSAHIGELGSQENVAQAKEELYLAAPKAIAIFNISNEWTLDMHERHKSLDKKIITFSSFNSHADIQFRVEKTSLNSIFITGQINKIEGHAEVSVFGRHNVNNLMGAAAIALSLGVSEEQIWISLSECHSGWGRNELYEHTSKGAKIIFDAYNANPESMQALLKNIYELEIHGNTYVILGEMFEMGSERKRVHEELGFFLSNCGYQWVCFVGESYREFQRGLEKAQYKGASFCFAEFDQNWVQELESQLKTNDLVLIKASRGMKFERILDLWKTKKVN